MTDDDGKVRARGILRQVRWFSYFQGALCVLLIEVVSGKDDSGIPDYVSGPLLLTGWAYLSVWLIKWDRYIQ